MRHCPICKSPVIQQPVLNYSAIVCLRCYSLGITRTTLMRLVDKAFFNNYIEPQIDSPRSSTSPTGNLTKLISCFYCNKTTQALSLKPNQQYPNQQYKENLRLFSNWTYRNDQHTKGELQLNYCPDCQYYWMNARTLCQLPIDWINLESAWRESARAEQEAKSRRETDPLQFIAGHLLGIPELENVPSFHELPVCSYLIGIGAAIVTQKALKDPSVFDPWVLNPAQTGVNLIKTMFTYWCINKSWALYLINIAPFLIFAPLVEHELEAMGFLLLIITSAVATAVLQLSFFPAIMAGSGCVVSAVITFFCFRFPTSIVGFGMLRFTAPVALLIFLTFDLKSIVDGLFDQSGAINLLRIGGAGVGLLFHLVMPTGKSTKAFKKMAAERLKKESSPKNWRNTS